MRQVEIKIFNIGRTTIDREEVQRWLDHIGADQYDLPTEDTISNPALLIALAAKRCYMSFQPGLNRNVTKVRQDLSEYLDNILKSGHGSVLEHSVYTFAMEGISRVFTAEMNRHRAGWAISEGSLRYIRFSVDRDADGNKVPDTGIPWWCPPSLREAPDDSPDIVQCKRRSWHLFAKAFTQQEEIYEELLDIWNIDEEAKKFSEKKKLTSLFRRIVGLGVATGGVWSGNIRALRHVITMRAAPEAEEEIAVVFSQIAKRMRQYEPYLFADFEETSEGYFRPKYRKV